MFSQSKLPKGLELKLVFAVYLGLALVSGLWSWMSQGSFFASWEAYSWPSILSLFFGTVAVFAYVLLSQFCSSFFEWGRQLEKALQHLMTPLSYFQIMIIALLSGFVEEWFFRGVLYSHFGLVVSSLAFGACHFFPAPKIWVWSLWSFFAGIAFCLILKTSGSLLLCALIHSAINAVGLILLNQRTYRQASFQSLS